MASFVGGGFGKSEVCMEIVCCLGQDARPVDRVYCGKAQGFIYLWISEEGFDYVLVKVE